MKHPEYRWSALSKTTNKAILIAKGTKFELGAVIKNIKPGKNDATYTAISYITESLFDFPDIKEAKEFVEVVVKNEFAKMREAE